MTKVLSDASCKSLSDALKTIRNRATECLQHSTLSSEWKRLAFVGVGWTRPSLEKAYRPIFCRVSNFHDERGHEKREASKEFRVALYVAKNTEPFLHSTLQSSSPDFGTPNERGLFRKNIRRSVTRTTGPAAFVRLLAIMIRQVSTRNQAVGKNLLAVSLPRASMGTPMMAVSGLETDMRSFIFIPEGQNEGISYGSNVACPRVGLTDFKVTEVREVDN